jgi:preprotein translocase subunit SecF
MLTLMRRLNAGEAVFDFIGSRKRWYLVSLALLLICLGSFVFRGFNFGIEFSGGTSFQFRAAQAQPAEVQEVAEQAGAEVPSPPQVVGTGGTRSILVKAGELSPQEQTRVADALESRFGEEVTVQAVSSSWGGDITNAAIRALLIFLVAVCIFIAIRFEWKMAVGAIVALFHDLLLTAGVYSLVGFEVTPSTIVGLLTILGFSLYDTVVVFDKVDENARGILGGSRTTYSQAANLAVNQTLMRSINTSLIALLPVAGLLFVGAGLLGVGTIKDLALVLFVGLAAGAYSSIFLATPIVCDLKEREPKYAALRKRVAAKKAAEARPAGRAAGPAGRAPAGRRSGRGATAATLVAEPEVLDADVADDEDVFPDEADEPVPATTAPGRRPARRGSGGGASGGASAMDGTASGGASAMGGAASGGGASSGTAAGGTASGGTGSGATAAGSTPRPGARPKRPQQRRGGGGRPSAKKRR